MSVLNALLYFFITVGLQDILETKLWCKDLELSFSKEVLLQYHRPTERNLLGFAYMHVEALFSFNSLCHSSEKALRRQREMNTMAPYQI